MCRGLYMVVKAEATDLQPYDDRVVHKGWAQSEPQGGLAGVLCCPKRVRFVARSEKQPSGIEAAGLASGAEPSHAAAACVADAAQQCAAAGGAARVLVVHEMPAALARAKLTTCAPRWPAGYASRTSRPRAAAALDGCPRWSNLCRINGTRHRCGPTWAATAA
eukprot:scaffold100399_cov35-Tisochrysis_lutea.AAC.2